MEILGQKNIDSAWTYDSEESSYVYHMSGINFTTNAPTALIIKGRLVIDVVGENTITTECTDMNGGLGVIYSDDSLIIKSDNSDNSALNVINNNKYPFAGIYGSFAVSIFNTTVNIKTADSTLTNGESIGIFSGWELTIGSVGKKTIVDVEMGDITINPGNNSDVTSYGISAGKIISVGDTTVTSMGGNIRAEIDAEGSKVIAKSYGCLSYSEIITGHEEDSSIVKFKACGGDVDYISSLSIDKFVMDSISIGLCFVNNQYFITNSIIVAKAGSVHGNDPGPYEEGNDQYVSSIALRCGEIDGSDQILEVKYSSVTLTSSVANNERADSTKPLSEISCGMKVIVNVIQLKLCTTSFFVVSEGCRHCNSFGIEASVIILSNENDDDTYNILSIVAKSDVGSVGFKKMDGADEYINIVQCKKKPIINILSKTHAFEITSDTTKQQVLNLMNNAINEGGTTITVLPDGKYTTNKNGFNPENDVAYSPYFVNLPVSIAGGSVDPGQIYYSVITDAYGSSYIDNASIRMNKDDVKTPALPTYIPAGMKFSHWVVTDVYGNTKNISQCGASVELIVPAYPFENPGDGNQYSFGPIYFTAVLVEDQNEIVEKATTGHGYNASSGTTVVLYADSGEEANRSALTRLGQKDTASAWEFVNDHYVYHMSGIDYKASTPCAILIVGDLTIDVVGKNSVSTQCAEVLSEAVIETRGLSNTDLILQGDSVNSALDIIVEGKPVSGLSTNELTVNGLEMNISISNSDITVYDDCEVYGIYADKIFVGDGTAVSSIVVDMGSINITYGESSDAQFKFIGINSVFNIKGNSKVVSNSADVHLNISKGADVKVHSVGAILRNFEVGQSASAGKPTLLLSGGDIDYKANTSETYNVIPLSCGLESYFKDDTIKGCRIVADAGSVIGHITKEKAEAARSLGYDIHAESIGLVILNQYSDNVTSIYNSSITTESSFAKNDCFDTIVDWTEMSTGLWCPVETTKQSYLSLMSTSLVIESAGCANSDSYGLIAAKVTLDGTVDNPSIVKIVANKGSDNGASIGFHIPTITGDQYILTTSPIEMKNSSFFSSVGSKKAVDTSLCSDAVKTLFQSQLWGWANNSELICVDSTGNATKTPQFTQQSDIIDTKYVSYIGVTGDDEVSYVAISDYLGIMEIQKNSLGINKNQCLTPSIPTQSELPQGIVFSYWYVADGFGNTAEIEKADICVFEGTDLIAGGPIFIETVVEEGFIITISGEGITVMNGDVAVNSGDAVKKQSSLTVAIKDVEGKTGHITANGVEISQGEYTVSGDVEFKGYYTDNGSPSASNDSSIPLLVVFLLAIIAVLYVGIITRD